MTSESLTSLAAIAAVVDDIRVGTLLASAPFGHPSIVALAAATINEISNGRMEFGLWSRLV